MRRIENTALFAAIWLGLALCATACNQQSESPQPPTPAQDAQEVTDAPEPAPPTPPAAKPPAQDTAARAAAGSGDPEKGQADYQIFCASCHGPTGDGDGPVSQALDPKPARHSDGEYMNALTDDDLFQVIKFGGQSVGKSALMAPWGGALSDQQIENVIAFVRTLANEPGQP